MVILVLDLGAPTRAVVAFGVLRTAAKVRPITFGLAGLVAVTTVVGMLLSTLRLLNVALRGVMEAGIVAALAYWGVRTGDSAVAKVILGVGAPVVGFGLWGAVDFREASSLAEPLRLLEELVISALAALALYAAGSHALAWGLALLSALHHALVYALGTTLLTTAARRHSQTRAEPGVDRRTSR